MKDRKLFSHARQLKRKATLEEKILWQKIRPSSGFVVKFRRQHIIDPYILDFYSPEALLAVEVDGLQHGEKDSIEKDAKRTAFLSTRGILLIRFWNIEVRKELVQNVEYLEQICRERVASPFLSGNHSAR